MIRISPSQPVRPTDLDAVHVAKAAWGQGIGNTLNPDVASITGAPHVWREVSDGNLPPRAINIAWRGTKSAALTDRIRGRLA
mgnify:CR=1 FL=1